jgi:glycosyltransferase involved in cell wall biosynthesis
LTELGIKSGEVVIGTIARLDAVKNQPLMLQATRALIDQGYKVRLLLVGDGPERENLEAITRQLELTGPASRAHKNGQRSKSQIWTEIFGRADG